MKLSLEIIRHYLEKDYDIAIAGPSQNSLELDRPKLFHEGCTPYNGELFIIEAKQFDQAAWEGCSLICVGGTEPQFVDRDIPVLLLGPGPIGKVANDVHKIFDFFDRWDLALSATSKNEDKAFAKIIEASKVIFDNDIILMNTNFQLEYFHVSNTLLNLLTKKPDEFGFLPFELVNIFKMDDFYNMKNSVREPFIYPAGMIPFRSLCMNLFFEDKLTGRIIILEHVRPVHAVDLELLAHMAAYIQEAYSNYLTLRTYTGYELRNTIKNILTGSDPSAPELAEMMKTKQWKENDEYICSYVKLSQRDEEINNQLYICRKIESLFKGACAVDLDKGIVSVINIAQSGYTYDALQRELASFVRKGFYRIGVSNKFNHIVDLRLYFMQAKAAIETGIQHNPQKWLYRFQDNSVQYLLDRCVEGLPAEFACHDDLFNLKKIDAETGSSYYKSLSLYLKSCKNAAYTSNEMFIHRLTLKYRLNKIKEITNLRWDTPEEYFQLLFYVYLAERDRLSGAANHENALP